MHKLRKTTYTIFTLLTLFVTIGFSTTSVFALSNDQKRVLQEGILYFNTEDYANCGAFSGIVTDGSGSGGSTAAPSAVQAENAQIIIGVAKTENLGQQAALIGLMVGLTESSLTNLANQNIPLSEVNPLKQGDGKDHDSLGVFQQRISTNWSTISTDPGNGAAVAQLMTPAYAAEAFFGSPPGADVPTALRKGLQNVGGWQNLTPWMAAQTVQASGSADGSNYRVKLATAQALLAQYWAAAPAVPLPVPLSGGTTASPSDTSAGTCLGATGGAANAAATAGNSSAITQSVIQAGLNEIAKNIPYSYGGGGPNGPSTGICNDTGCAGTSTIGFDCSSFMQFIFYQGGKINLPRTAQSQYNATVGQDSSVDLANIQPGDMIFYGSSKTNIEHVVMYIGAGKIIEAAHTGTNLREVDLYKDGGGGNVIQGIGYLTPIGT